MKIKHFWKFLAILTTGISTSIGLNSIQTSNVMKSLHSEDEIEEKTDSNTDFFDLLIDDEVIEESQPPIKLTEKENNLKTQIQNEFKSIPIDIYSSDYMSIEIPVTYITYDIKTRNKFHDNNAYKGRTFYSFHGNVQFNSLKNPSAYNSFSKYNLPKSWANKKFESSIIYESVLKEPDLVDFGSSEINKSHSLWDLISLINNYNYHNFSGANFKYGIYHDHLWKDHLKFYDYDPLNYSYRTIYNKDKKNFFLRYRDYPNYYQLSPPNYLIRFWPKSNREQPYPALYIDNFPEGFYATDYVKFRNINNIRHAIIMGEPHTSSTFYTKNISYSDNSYNHAKTYTSLFFNFDNLIRMDQYKFTDGYFESNLSWNWKELLRQNLDVHLFSKISKSLNFNLNYSLNDGAKQKIVFTPEELFEGKKILIPIFNDLKPNKLKNVYLTVSVRENKKIDLNGENERYYIYSEKNKFNKIENNNKLLEIFNNPIEEIIFDDSQKYKYYPSEVLKTSILKKFFKFYNSKKTETSIKDFYKKLKIKLKINDVQGWIEVEYTNPLNNLKFKNKVSDFLSLPNFKTIYEIESKEINNVFYKNQIWKKFIETNSGKEFDKLFLSKLNLIPLSENDLDNVLIFLIDFNEIQDPKIKKQWIQKYQDIRLQFFNKNNIAPIQIKSQLSKSPQLYNEEDVWLELLKNNVFAQNKGISKSDFKITLFPNKNNLNVLLEINKKEGLEKVVGSKNYNFVYLEPTVKEDIKEVLENDLNNEFAIEEPKTQPVQNSNPNQNQNLKSNLEKNNSEAKDKENPETQNKTNIIVGSAIGSLAFIALVTILVSSYLKKKKAKKLNSTR